MELKVVCCMCHAVLKDGEEPASHTYCKVCGAAQLRQLDIWDFTKKMEGEETLCLS